MSPIPQSDSDFSKNKEASVYAVSSSEQKQESCQDRERSQQKRKKKRIKKARAHEKTLHGKWNQGEQSRFINFCRLNHEFEENIGIRKRHKFFVRMSKFIKTRSAEQCRSHYQKYKAKLDFNGILSRERDGILSRERDGILSREREWRDGILSREREWRERMTISQKRVWGKFEQKQIIRKFPMAPRYYNPIFLNFIKVNEMKAITGLKYLHSSEKGVQIYEQMSTSHQQLFILLNLSQFF